MKIHIKKGDQVKVISGEAKGSEGKVVSIDRANYRAVLEGINLVSKHTKPSAASPQGGIVKKEAGIHISNLQLVDASTKKADRVGRKKDEQGNAVRFFKKSGEVIK
jgi:large subunit ribosomal protein L24